MKAICNRFEIIEYISEVGRSGIPALAVDSKTNEIVFVKYPDYNDFSQSKFEQQLGNIKNEIIAVTTLKGFGSPRRICECVEWNKFTGFQGEGLRETPYLITEKVDQADRIEETYADLLEFERFEILAQLFEILHKAHENKFNHGDIDFKHLYWQRESGRLVIIDWANSVHYLSDNAKEQSFDIAKSAEIVYSLLVLEPFPIDQEDSLLPLPNDAPDLLRQLCQWAPRQGWPSDFPQEFYARNISTVVREWVNSKYQHFEQDLNDWIPHWVKDPSGDEWKNKISLSFKKAPHRGLTNIGILTLADIKQIKLIEYFERSYNQFCDSGDWRAARNIVHELLSRKLINDKEGYLLSQVFAYLQNKEAIRYGFGEDALKFLLTELLDSKSILSEQYLSSLLEVTTRTLIHDLPNDNFLKWNETSLINQLLHISALLAETNNKSNFTNQEASNFSKIHNELLSQINILCEAYENEDISKLLLAYTELSSTLKAIEPLINNRHICDLDKTKQIIEHIKENLDKILIAVDQGNRLLAIDLLKNVWLLDRHCHILFKQWFQLLESSSVDSLILGSSINLPNKSSKILFDAISRTIEVIQPIKLDKNISLVEKCRKLEEILVSIPKSLPPRWQIEPAILEWLALFDALIFTMKISKPLWVIEKYDQNREIPFLNQSKKLLGEIRSFIKDSNGVSEYENVGEINPFNINANEIGKEYPDPLTNEKPATSIDLTPKHRKDVTIHPRVGLSKSSMKLPILFAVSMLVMTALGVFFSFITFNREVFAVPTPIIKNTLEQATETITPTTQSKSTLKPSQTPLPTFTSTVLPSFTPTTEISPTENIIVSNPSPIISSNQLMQFNSFSSISPNEPFSVFISPELPNDLSKKIRTQAGFYHDSDTGYWRVKSYPLSIISEYPELNPVRVNLGTLLFRERFNMANSLSILGNSISLQSTSGTFGIYLIDASSKRIEFLIKLEGNGIILQTNIDNKVIEKKVIMDKIVGAKDSKINYWMYLQINHSTAQIFLNIDNIDSLRATSLTDLQFISSYPVESNLRELGLIAYDEADILIEKMILYGDQ